MPQKDSLHRPSALIDNFTRGKHVEINLNTYECFSCSFMSLFKSIKQKATLPIFRIPSPLTIQTLAVILMVIEK